MKLFAFHAYVEHARFSNETLVAICSYTHTYTRARTHVHTLKETSDVINLVSHRDPHVICGIAEVLLETYKTSIALKLSIISVPDISACVDHIRHCRLCCV